jgi:hypothetical protein
MKDLVPLYSRNRTEAEIQADIYADLKATGLEPRLEVRGYITGPPRRKCLFDIVVFWPLNHRPLCIIECKKGNGCSKANRQIAKYKTFGLPVLVCGKRSGWTVMDDVLRLAVLNANDAPPSFNWSAILAATNLGKPVLSPKDS